jgi:hypothetical protein
MPQKGKRRSDNSKTPMPANASLSLGNTKLKMCIYLHGHEDSGDHCNNEADSRTALQTCARAAQLELVIILPVKCNILLDGLVQTLSIHDIQAHEIIRLAEEHVAVRVEALEARCVVGKPHGGIGGRGVAQKDTLYLVREVVGELRVVLHDVAVGGVGDEHKLALGEGGKDLLQQEHADGERGGHIGEVERASVKGAAGVGLVDEVHVVAGCLLGGGGQVVEVRVVGEGARPVGVDLGHVLPLHKGARKGIEEALLGVVDLGDAQDVVNVGDERDALGGDEEGGGVSAQRAVGVNVEALHVVGRVTGEQAVLLDGHEDVKVALGGGLVGQRQALGAAGRGDGIAAARLAVAALHGRGLQRHGDILVALLDHVDGAREVAGLGLSLGRQLVDRGPDQEAVGQVVDLALRDVGELVDVAAEADLPALVGPVPVRGDVEHLGGLRSEVVADAELREHLRAGREAFEPTGDAWAGC